MVRLRVLNCRKQPNQPFNQEEDDYRKREDNLVEFDVNYLIRCLNIDRNTSHEIVSRPDAKNRKSPQPDYLVRENKTGKLIAIERARFFESEEAEKSLANLVEKSSGIISRWIEFPIPEKLGQRLSEFFSEKMGKGQFKDYGNCERILLVHNYWGGVTIRGLIDAETHFNFPEPIKCDHFYLIVEQRLLEIF